MKRSQGISLLIVFVLLVLSAEPGWGIGKRPVATAISSFPATVFPLPGGGDLISVPTPAQGSDRYTLHLIKLDPAGGLRPLGSYPLEVRGIQDRAYIAVNRLPELRYLILPREEGYLLIYEFLKAKPEEEKPIFHTYTSKEVEMGLRAVLLRPGGEVQPKAELVISGLVEPPEGYGREGIWPVELAASEDGKEVELYLISKSDLFSNGTLYRYRIAADSLKVLDGPENLGRVCSECLVQEAGGKLVVFQIASPLVKYFSEQSDEAHYLMIDNLDSGPTFGRVYQRWMLFMSRPPMPFGEGWVQEFLSPADTWVRLGETWYLASKFRRETPLVRTDGEGRMLRLIRLPQRWKLQISKDPDLIMLRNLDAPRFVLMDSRGTVRAFEIGENGSLRAGAIPEWLRKRLKLLAYQPFDLDYELLEKKKRELFYSGKNSVELVAGIGAVGVAVRPDYNQPTTMRVMSYDGKPLYEVSFPEYQPPVDPSFLKPEGLSDGKMRLFTRLRSKLVTPDGVYLLFRLKLSEREFIPAWELRPRDKENAYRFALVRVTPEGKAEFVGTINLAEAVEKAGMVVDEKRARLKGDLLTALNPSTDPNIYLMVAPGRGEGRALVRFEYPMSKTRVDQKMELGLIRRGPMAIPDRVISTPDSLVCELDLSTAELGECRLLLNRFELEYANLASQMLLYPGQVRWPTDLRLKAPVFFQGWAGYQEEAGTSIRLNRYQREVEILGYSELGFLGYLYSPTQIEYLDRYFRPSNLTHRLLCRWNEEGQIRACIYLPSFYELRGIDPGGSGILWLQAFHSEHGRVALMADVRSGRMRIYYQDNGQIAEQDYQSPYLSFALQSVAGPVQWKPLPNLVFYLHPGPTPDYRRLVEERGEILQQAKRKGNPAREREVQDEG